MYVLGTACLAISFLDGYPRLVLLSVLSVCSLGSFGLYGFLRSLPITLTIHSLGNIQSMGVVIFLAGKNRIACPHSRFLIHPLHWTFTAGKVDHSRLREHLGSLDNDLDRYAQIFEERTQGAKKALKIKPHLSSQEKIISAHEALDFGIVQRVEQAAIPQSATVYFVPST